MIDERTGEITIPIDNFRIHKDLNEKELTDSLYYNNYLREKSDMKTGYIWYYFSPVSLMNREIIFVLCLRNGTLDRVEFCVDSNDLPSSWSNWSEEGELKRKQLNEELLFRIFNDGVKRNKFPERYDFTWGHIISVYDQKSGGSDIILRYNKD